MHHKMEYCKEHVREHSGNVQAGVENVIIGTLTAKAAAYTGRS